MALTRDFRETIVKRAQKDPAYRRTLLTRGLRFVLNGSREDVAVGKAMIRDYINATIGFQALAKRLEKKPESLMRMFSNSGNPRLDNVAEVFHELEEYEGIQFTVTARRAAH